MRRTAFPGRTHFRDARGHFREGKQLRWDPLGIMGGEGKVETGAASPGGGGRRGGGGGGRAAPGERKRSAGEGRPPAAPKAPPWRCGARPEARRGPHGEGPEVGGLLGGHAPS